MYAFHPGPDDGNWTDFLVAGGLAAGLFLIVVAAFAV